MLVSQHSGKTGAKKLSRREREVLDILHTLDRATAEEVREAMAEAPTNPAVRAILRSLVDKGHLRHEYDGPRYIYTPTVPREKARRSALEHVLRTFFGGSVESAVATLLEIESEDLSEEARQRLKEKIDEAQREGR